VATEEAPSDSAPGVASVGDVPVARAMLHGVRDELRARLDQNNARIDELNARFDGLRTEVIAQVHRIGTIVEEQAVRNRVVMEVVQGHNLRFERIEARLDHLTEMVGGSSTC
jgi:capsule polysaccharide export protein KpsE/RkpR